MANCKRVVSNLDRNAAEFIPQSEFKELVLTELRKIMETIFNSSCAELDIQVQKIKDIINCPNAQAPRTVGMVLAETLTSKFSRVNMGFRCFKSIRAQLSMSVGSELEFGVTSAIASMTERLISSNSLELLMSESKYFLSNPNKCASVSHTETEGDVPVNRNNSIHEHVFALVAFMKLLITNLNVPEHSDGLTNIPPLRPCVDFCLLVSSVFKLQTRFLRGKISYDISNEPSLTNSIFALVNERNWDGLLYQLLDGFSQALVYFNTLLAQQNLHALCGDWQRMCIADKPASNENTSASSMSNENLDSASHLSILINQILSSLRELLLGERLPLKLLRSVALDTLMCASELAVIQNSSYQGWTESNELCEDDIVSDNNHSNESLNDFDEKWSDYQLFLRESGQV